MLSHINIAELFISESYFIHGDVHIDWNWSWSEFQTIFALKILQ